MTPFNWILTTFLLAGWSQGVPLTPYHPTTTPKVHIDPPPRENSFVGSDLCSNKLDIVIMIDSSGSVQKVWNDIIDNAQILLSNFLINSEYTRVSVTDFSAVSNVYNPLDTINSDEKAFQTFEKLRNQPQNGETWVELGIDRANDIFKAASPFRENVRKVVVMYTDGKLTSGDTESVKALMKAQRTDKIETFVVKVSKNISNEGIVLLGCKPSNIFNMVPDPSVGENNLKNAVCGGTSEIKPTPNPTQKETTTPSVVKTTKGTVDKMSDVCSSPVDPGPCKSSILRVFYNNASKSCQFFEYGGCGGNGNNFGSIRECEKTCIVNNATTTTTSSPSQINIPSEEPLVLLPPRINSQSKCEYEHDNALFVIQSKVETVFEVFVPKCNKDGTFEEIQHHEGTGYYWCVNQETGEVINGTKTLNSIPHCPEKDDQNLTTSQSLTKCETEREEKMKMVRIIPDMFVPKCSKFDGLYMEIQENGFSMAKWCVNRYNGETINGTFIDASKYKGMKPLCPEQSKCETERDEAIHAHYKFPNINGQFVPQCATTGLYAKIQVHGSTGNAWCVNEVTGEEINGTRKAPVEGIPVCPGEVNPVCLLPKVVGQCRAAVPGYFYNSNTARCENFIYGGCNGNNNRFATLEECEETCGMLTRCLIDREVGKLMEPISNATIFVPDCDQDGLFKKMQKSYNGSTWCVNQIDGLLIPETLVNDDEANCENLSMNATQDGKKHEPKCREDELLDSTNNSTYHPKCTPEGFYQDIQEAGSIIWCAHKYTGIEVEGTKQNTSEGPIVCPDHENKDCLLPKDHGSCKALFPRYYYDWQHEKCVRFSYSGCDGNENNFATLKLCEEACNVKPKNETALAPTLAPTIKAGDETNKSDNGTTKPEPEPEHEPEVKQIGDADIYHPENPCSVELDFSKSRNIANHVIGGYLPQCEGNGDYKIMQHHPGTGYRWCINPKTGHMIEGTNTAPGVRDPECSNVSNGTDNKENITTDITDKNQLLISSTGHRIVTDMFHPTETCSMEYEFAKQANTLSKMAGNFEPQCDATGDYKTMQIHVSSGYRWCVDQKTGALIEGTKTPPNEQDPDCKTATAVTSTTPYAVPEPEPSPKTPDMFHPGNPCTSELDFARQSNIANHAVGGWEPVCEANGDYKEIQSHGSTGTSWCVDPKTGHEVEGTRTNPGEGVPDCTKGKKMTGPEMKESTTTKLSPATTSSTTVVVNSSTTLLTTTTTKTPTYSSPTTAIPSSYKANANSVGDGKNSKTDDAKLNGSNLESEKQELNDLAKSCPFEIGTNLTKYGCFHDDQQIPRPLPVLLIKDTSINVEEPSKNDDWKEFIRGFVCKCAMETSKRGWFTFGIQNYGECYSGPDEGRYDEDREANEDMCIDEKQDSCKLSDKQACSGISKDDPETKKTKFANYVFMIKTETHKKIERIEYAKKKRKRSIHKNKHRYGRKH